MRRDCRPEEQAFSTRDLDRLGGKILHIDRDGLGLPTNPHWNGDSSANRSKVWAHGFRNPFRLVLLDEPEPTLLVAEVGTTQYDELNLVRRGADHGWPCTEGLEPTDLFEDDDRCKGSSVSTGVEPWIALKHPEFRSLSGGVILDAENGWPAPYADTYVFGDWQTSTLYVVKVASDSSTEQPREIAQNAGGPVAFSVGPDGTLYYLALNIGELRTIAPR